MTLSTPERAQDGGDADADLLEAELSALAGNDEVAGRDQREAEAEGVTVDPAMIGFQTASPLSREVRLGTSRNVPARESALRPRRPAPTLKALPAPVTMGSSSSRKRSQAPFRSSRSSWLVALRTSGRGWS